jgi:hypothetical protein
MRALLFWSLMLMAIFAGTSALIGSSVTPLAFPESFPSWLPSYPEQSRSVLFGLGLVALTFTYRRAWLSWAKTKN